MKTDLSILMFPQVRLNPYTSMLGDAMSRRGVRLRVWSPWAMPLPEARVLHLHWIEAIAYGPMTRRSKVLSRLAFLRLEAAMRSVQRCGGKVFWTAHNVRPHDNGAGAFARMVQRGVDRIVHRVDGIIAMSHTSAAEVAQAYPDLTAPIHVIPHPSYQSIYPNARRGELRRELAIGTEKKIIGLIGLIRPYKEHLEAIRIFKQITNPDLVLLISGKCYENRLLQKIQESANSDSRIRILARELTDAEFAEAILACDLIFVPQKKLLNSGVVIAALTLGVPVLASPAGSLTEVQDVVGAEWLHLHKQIDANVIEDILDRAKAGAAPDLSHFALDRVVDMHLDAYGYTQVSGPSDLGSATLRGADAPGSDAMPSCPAAMTMPAPRPANCGTWAST